MFNYSVLFLLICIGYYNTQGSFLRNTNDVVHFSDRIESLITKKCLQNANQAAANEALDELHHFIHCWQNEAPNKKLSAEKSYDNCMENSKNFSAYLEVFVEKLTPCFNSQEKYLGQFILDSYGDHNHYSCKSLTENDGDDCMAKFHDHPEKDPLISCYKKSQIFGQTQTLGVITKEKLCDDVSDIDECYEEMFEEHCPNSTNFKNLRMILLKQALENCD